MGMLLGALYMMPVTFRYTLPMLQVCPFFGVRSMARLKKSAEDEIQGCKVGRMLLHRNDVTVFCLIFSPRPCGSGNGKASD